jgi:rhamnose transport system ATP-binding protein
MEPWPWPRMPMPQPLVELKQLAKSFGGVPAIAGIDLAIDAGEIVGLVGENGAGKSTVIKLLSGVYAPDQGSIEIAGRLVNFASPRDALDAGVTTIQQELTGFDHLSLAENMLMGEPWPRKPWGGVDWSALYAESGRRMADFGIALDAHRALGEMTAAEKQEIAIAGALARKARLVILDEPTASLTEPEVKRLFVHLRRLRSQGVTILYVSHRLDEIFALTDRIVVLRDGSVVAQHATGDINPSQLVRAMVGRSLDQISPKTRPTSTGAPALELLGVARAGMFHGVNLTVHAGEIVGLAGLVGAGRSELARAVYGLYPIDEGSMSLCGRPWRPTHPRQSVKAGLVYIPEERKRQGLVLEHSLSDAIGIGISDRLARFGLVPPKTQNRLVQEAIGRYDIRAGSAEQAIVTLSGGNQQKALLARWLERDPQVIILDEPTRGVDVGAKSQIHSLIDRLAAAGKAVLLISSDLGEVIGMSDRIFVMNRGTIETELTGDEKTEHNVVLASSGLYRAEIAAEAAGGRDHNGSPP